MKTKSYRILSLGRLCVPFQGTLTLPLERHPLFQVLAIPIEKGLKKINNILYRTIYKEYSRTWEKGSE